MNMKKTKIIMLSEPNNPNSAILLDWLAQEPDFEIMFVVTSTKIINGKRAIKSFIKMIRMSGWWYFFGRVHEALYYKYSSHLTFRKVAELNGITEHKTDNASNPEFVAFMKSENPDIIVSCVFNQILKQELLDVPKFGCINVHRSMLPRDRGLSATFNALAWGYEYAGVTIHQIEAGLDTGAIYHQESVKVYDDDTVFSLSQRMMQAIKEPLVQVINGIANGTLKPQPQVGGPTKCGNPTKETVKMFRKTRHRFV